AVAVHCGKRLSAPASWLACVGALFLIQLGAVYHLLPDYNRRFSLRGQVRRQLQRPLGQHLPVLCYPRGWDSVRFYLRRDDVAVYGEAELREMIERLKEEQRALLFVKRDGPLRRFLSALPGWLEFIPDAQQRGNVVVGMVRPRQRQTEPRLVHR
ncbi:MAG TPA: hypothetical protein VNN17_08840, partial [Terriglobia bacterium]|nr:hypothetical protein [Terriglobia bacterium]